MTDLTGSDRFIPYLISRITKTSIWLQVQRIIRYSRRFLLIGRIVKYIGIAVTVIETSAVLIVIAAMLVALIPLMLAALAVFGVADLIIGSRILKSRWLEKYLERERVYVIAKAGGFGEGFARELANSGAAVFVITVDPRRRFISALPHGGVCYIRHAFFFRLKRKRMVLAEQKLTYLL